MKIKILVIIISFFYCNNSFAQLSNRLKTTYPLGLKRIDGSNIKIFTRSYGMIVGIQRGKYTFLEVGAEMHWRKILAIKPRLWAVTANMEYNFSENVLGYKLTYFAKRGRINFTYGANLIYFTNFTDGKIGLGPSIGFKLLGFHFINGFNFYLGKKEVPGGNSLYISIRYFIPIRNKVRIEKSK